MPKDILTDADVEFEIARLRENEHVKLAQEEINIRYRRRKYLYQLRWLEKRGRELEQQGFTMENMEARMNPEGC